MPAEQTDLPEQVPGKIRIFGTNKLKGPIFESDDAGMLVMYDEENVPCMALIRMVGGTWLMGTVADPDWDVVKQRYGIS